MFLKKGQIVEADPSNGWFEISKKTPCHEGTVSGFLYDYKDDFAPISEEEEKIEEAKKLLEGEGYQISKLTTTKNREAVYVPSVSTVEHHCLGCKQCDPAWPHGI